MLRIIGLSLLGLLLISGAALAVAIPTVPVGDLGNANDPATGGLYGGVSYAYGIGTTEVTVGQYVDFLNAVAATDTYKLYSTFMATDPFAAGISRSGSSGSYTYRLIGAANYPVTYVTWGDAARFANWLHNGQPTGAQGPGTTETGAYTLNGAMTDAALAAATRNPGARWFIPTESEWYKAAYFQPAAQGGDADSYWSYPMRTNSLPYSDQPPGTTPDNTRVGNFRANDNLTNGYNDGYAVTGSTSLNFSQNYLTTVGAYTWSSSFYGTFDQGGNVWEWNETLISGALRDTRGGSWGSDVSRLAASDPGSGIAPTIEHNILGFRVATVAVPEPSTYALAVLGLASLLLSRRLKRRQH